MMYNLSCGFHCGKKVDNDTEKSKKSWCFKQIKNYHSKKKEVSSHVKINIFVK